MNGMRASFQLYVETAFLVVFYKLNRYTEIELAKRFTKL